MPGKHVLVQKPHAIRAPEILEMEVAAQEAGENAPVLLFYAPLPKQPKDSACRPERCNRRPLSRPRLWEIQFHP